MPCQPRYQFVLRDTACLGKLGPVIEAVHSLLTALDDAASVMLERHEGLTEVLHSFADYLQVYTAMATGVEVCPSEAEQDVESDRIHLALRTLRRHASLETNNSDVTTEHTHKLRNHLQTVLTQFHLYRTQVETHGSSRMTNELFRAACHELHRIVHKSDDERGTSGTLLSSAGSGSAQVHAYERMTTSELGRRRVILVEDNPETREVLRSFLANHGYHVTTFTDGEEALQYIDDARPDAILILDMKLPRCDGPTTVRRIRQNHNERTRQMHIIGMSGASLRENQIELGDQGVTSWFRKPFNPDALLEVLSKQIIAADDSADFHAA